MARIVSITVDNGEELQRRRVELEQERREQTMTYGFHADLTPPEPGTDAQRKRVVFNFDNGWSASMVLCASGANRASFAAVAAWPTADPEALELGDQEAFPDEVARFVEHVASRPHVAPRSV